MFILICHIIVISLTILTFILSAYLFFPIFISYLKIIHEYEITNEKGESINHKLIIKFSYFLLIYIILLISFCILFTQFIYFNYYSSIIGLLPIGLLIFNHLVWSEIALSKKKGGENDNT